MQIDYDCGFAYMPSKSHKLIGKYTAPGYVKLCVNTCAYRRRAKEKDRDKLREGETIGVSFWISDITRWVNLVKSTYESNVFIGPSITETWTNSTCIDTDGNVRPHIR